MRMENLKQGLWGYRKEDVYRCIVSMEEEFSQRLLEKDAQSAKMEEGLRVRIRELETELAQVRQECEVQQRAQTAISDALLNAQTYAQQLREETALREQDARQRIDREAQRQSDELRVYQQKLSRLRETLHMLLEELDSKAESAQEQTQQLQEAMPKPVMVLFQKKAE